MTTAKDSETTALQKDDADDADFAARIRGRDPEAIDEVVHSYMGQILRAARASGLSPQNAEDVTQATFATFLEVATLRGKIPRTHVFIRNPLQEDC